MQHEYGFSEMLLMSNGVSENASVGDILRDNIPGAMTAERAKEVDDRNGTDWWVPMTNGDRLSVDCKVREKDCIQAYGADDLALEIWSVCEKKIAGWTRRADKRTDYVLWLWKDSKRWCLVPFPMLCQVFHEKLNDWSLIYKHATQATPGFNGGGYHSECLFVPRKVVWRAIYDRFGGELRVA